MTWNYRLIHKTHNYKIKDTEYTDETVDVHEVYYYKNGEISSYSKEPICLGFVLDEGETVADTKYHVDDFISKLKVASEKPVLEMTELDAYFATNPRERFADPVEEGSPFPFNPDWR